MSFASVALCPAMEEVVNFPRFVLNLDNPILIFINIAESLNPMRVMDSDTLASTIQSIKGFFVKKQKLLYDGREVARDYEKLLHLVIKLYDLQAISLKTFGGKVIELFSIGYVKHKLSQLTLDDDQRLITSDLCKVIAKEAKPRDFFVEPVVVNCEIELPSILKELINSTIDGLEKGNAPTKSSDGSGGAYFMQDQSGHKYISVFKPIDEEPMAVNNPNGLPLSVNGEGLKKGTHVGEGAYREVAAYILDYPMTGPRTFPHDQTGFSGVPPTTMVKCLHKDFNHPNGYSFSQENTKIGSLQMFVSNVGTCEDMGYGVFPVDQVHQISVLDIRFANADRHGGNILVSRDGNDGQIVLTPIDHGYCFPNKVSDYIGFIYI